MLVVDIVIVIDTIVIVSIDTNDIIYIYTIVIDNVIVTYRPRFSNFRLEEEICQNPGKKIEVARTKMVSYNTVVTEITLEIRRSYGRIA